nr:polysaccharide deacetylase family protein [Maliibacterium massiliense]
MRVQQFGRRKGILLAAVLAVVLVAGLGGMVIAQGAGVSVFADNSRLVPIYRVDRSDKTIAISFDAAWGAEKTPQILDILDRYQIKTTFFLVGFWVDRYPERVQLIAQRGHEIGNHSTNHPHLPKLGKEQIATEIQTTHDKIKELTGQEPKLCRPPFGDYNNAVLEVLHEKGYEGIQWDVDSLDWKEQGVDAIVSRVTGKVQPGSIILFHNNSRDIVEALPLVLDKLIADGYQIVPISQLLHQAPYTIDNQGVQHKAS